MAADADHVMPGREILEILLSHPGEFGGPMPEKGLAAAPVIPGMPGFVLDSEAGLLPGETPARSLSLAMPIRRSDFAGFTAGIETDAASGLAWAFGTDFCRVDSKGRQVDFMQILLVETEKPLSRPLISGLSSLRSLAGRLPGYLAHSVGNETTARIHRDLLAVGFSQKHLAAAHLDQIRARGFSGAAFVAVGIPSAAMFDMMTPYARELGLALERVTVPVSGETAESVVEGCYGRTCSECDEQDVCDRIRAVLKKYPRKTGKAR